MQTHGLNPTFFPELAGQMGETLMHRGGGIMHQLIASENLQEPKRCHVRHYFRLFSLLPLTYVFF